MAESDVVLEEHADERRFEEMLELEEQLVEERLETADDTDEEGGGEDDDRTAVGQVRAVYEDNGEVVVEFFADGEVWKDEVSRPADPEDPEAELNILCRLCGADIGRVTDVQGESVPVLWDDEREEYDLHLPSTVAQPGLSVYRAWWWVRRRGVSPETITTGIVWSIAVGVVLMGLNTFRAMLTVPSDEPLHALTAEAIPGITTATFESGGETGMLIGDVLGMFILLLASAVTAVLIVGGLGGAHRGVIKGALWIRRNAWPF